MENIKRNKVVFAFLALCAAVCITSAEEAAAVSKNTSDTAAVKRVAEAKPFYVKRGVASWYGKRFNGRRTASGERFNKNELTCAHRWLPFGSLVRVTNTNNGESVIVRVNDRGPYIGRRIIDLSDAAARKIGMIGCATVVIEAFPDTVSDVLYADAAQQEGNADIQKETDDINNRTDVLTETDSEKQCPMIRKASITGARYLDLAAAYTDQQSYDPLEGSSIIVDQHNNRVNIHGYTVVTAITHDYKSAARVRDNILARGFRHVYMHVSMVGKVSAFEVCVGFEPVAIACEMTQEQLAPDYPTTTVTYIEGNQDDPYQTTAYAN